MEEKNQTVYVCSKCGQPVEIKDNIVIRKCEHDKEVIIASISAKCTAKSGLN
jgi:DNA-directed RNA polymerase subunit RPC12/RpoP